jgi:retinol dehydrogenase-12
MLIASAASSPDHKARVINVSSMGHLFTSGVDLRTVRDGKERRALGPTKLYYQSKFVCILLLARSLAALCLMVECVAHRRM